MDQTIVVSITGKDHPGITAGVLGILAGAGAEVLDMEQVVVRGRLTLQMLVRIDESRAPLKDLLLFGWEGKLHIDFQPVDPEEAEPEPSPARFAVTVVGTRLGPATLGRVAEAIAGAGANIERIVRLSRYPVLSYELVVDGGDIQELRSGLLRASSAHGVDVSVQREGLERRAKRLVVIDMDSTLITDEIIDLLAAEAGVAGDVAAITAATMAGSGEFSESLARRVAMLEGLPEDRLEEVARRVRLTPGARTFARTLRRLGYHTTIVSGGFDVFAERVRRDLGMDLAFANTLEVVEGRLTGRLVGDVVDGAAKARLLRRVAAQEQVPMEQVVAVGDGANDLEMLSAAGLGIAFNAKPVVDAAADTTLKVPYLDAVLFLLGISRADIEAADRADGV